MPKFFVPGIAKPSKEIPISIYEDGQLWPIPSYKRTVVIIDRTVSKTVFNSELLENSLTITLDSSERIKSVDFLDQVISSNPQILEKFDAIIVIGGGTILNLGTALAAHLCKMTNGSLPDKTSKENTSFHLILVPTNVLSMADVAYGSLGKLNKTQTRDAIRVLYDPDYILLDIRYLENLPSVQKKHGLAECLKHALLQDSGNNPNSPKLSDCLKLLKSESPNVNELFSCILLTIKAKADIIYAINEGSSTAEYLLTYGHVDSDPREVASNFELSHGDSVLLSLIAELTIAGEEDLLNAVYAILPFIPLVKVAEKINFNRQTMLEAYRRSAKPRFCAGQDNYFVISLPHLGAYADIRNRSRDVELRKFSFDILYDVTQKLLHELSQMKHEKFDVKFFNSTRIMKPNNCAISVSFSAEPGGPQH